MRHAADGVGLARDPVSARLKRRADFLNAAKGRRVHTTAFTLQMASRRSPQSSAETDNSPARFGFTVTKKVGGSVERNRIRRRLKEALRLLPDLPVRAGSDYVVVARREALATPFAMLQSELARMVATVHRTSPKQARQTTKAPGRPIGRPGCA